MNTSSHVPPGFRFHPTDEELVDYYLRKKIATKKIDLDVIKDVDLYKIEPWDIQEKCKIGTEEQNDWYFFSHKDKKFPTGTRTNRATAAGFWKATGRDKPIYSKNYLVGMRKTLVYYKGRAPNGQKSDWIMHEYRLETNENGLPHEEGWVVCRAFKKRIATTIRRAMDESPCWFDDHMGFMPDLDSPTQLMNHPNIAYQSQLYPCKQELGFHYLFPQEPFMQLPHLESPKLPTNIDHGATLQSSSLTQEAAIGLSTARQLQIESMFVNAGNTGGAVETVTDWRVLDKLVASQLSHGDSSTPKESSYFQSCSSLSS